jgi:hypothetical protein
MVFRQFFFKLINDIQEDQEHFSRNHSSITWLDGISDVCLSEFGRSSDDGKGVEGLITIDEIWLVRVLIRNAADLVGEFVGLIEDAIDNVASPGKTLDWTLRVE